ncbi:hypothetical protein ACFW1A_37580 [Kitasatospora sp. NPDC058965]|uniref:hypothetical protein n=1 Tax=Kitasatospora sp. NPDC058965 TaxID=3346682 RepID=UPI003691DBDE
MADKDVEQTDQQGHAPGAWWADLGTWGAVATIVLGGVAAAWVTFRLPGTPENLASGYYGAAKVVAIGLVAVGGTLLSRRRARTAATTEETSERERV